MSNSNIPGVGGTSGRSVSDSAERQHSKAVGPAERQQNQPTEFLHGQTATPTPTPTPTPAPTPSDPDSIVIPVRESFYAVAARLGHRPRMEDAFIAIPHLNNYIASSSSSSSSAPSTSVVAPTPAPHAAAPPHHDAFKGFVPCLFGIFDGHSANKQSEDGQVASQSAAEVLPHKFVSHLLSGSPIKQSLHRAFEETDQALRVGAAGTTSTVVYLSGKDLYSANVGDSRGILVRFGKIYPLTKDHTPDDPEEAARVDAEGGHLSNHHGLRVEGRLNMTRSLGDSELPGVSAIPTIRHFDLGDGRGRNDDDRVIVLASDGLWGVVSNETAAKLVAEEIGRGCAAVATRLAEAAIQGKSTDNTCVIVIDLRAMKLDNL